MTTFCEFLFKIWKIYVLYSPTCDSNEMLLMLQARQPGIFKQDYLDELFGRYGDVNETPQAPPEPDWYNGP